jgi:hypothetical protein
VHTLQSYEGEAVWSACKAAAGQVRIAGTVIIGLDAASFLRLGTALGADERLLAEVFADLELILVSSFNAQADP